MIKTLLIGHLGKDCVVNNVNGKTVINFTVAHSEKYKNQQGVVQENTLWVDCAWWTDRTAVAPYLKKGTQVYVEGQPSVKSFTRNNGEAGAALAMRVHSLQLLGSKNSGDNTSQADPATSANQGTAGSGYVPMASEVTEPIDDLPF